MKNIFKHFKISAAKLILFSTLYFGFVLNISFWQYVVKNVECTNFHVFLFTVSLFFFILVPLYLLFSLVVVPKVAKPLLITLLIICAATNYMMFHYGVYINKDMIQNVFETNSREASDLLTPSLMLWVFVTGVVPSLLLALTKIEFAPFKKELKKRLLTCLIGVLIIAVFVPFTFKVYASFGRNHRQVKSLINIVNFTAGTVGYVKKIRLANKTFKILDANAKHMPFEDDYPTVLIFVLGETARAANFSLDGYQRETNPLLKKQDIVYFTEMTSCGTATAVSVPCMFSHMLKKDFDQTDAKFTQNLIDLMQSVDYDVIWKDNDDGCKGVCDRVLNTERMVKTNNPKYCNGKYCYDEVLLDGFEDIIKNIKKDTVIVLHTMGSHGPTYYQRYPENFKKFQPTCDTADIQNCSSEQIINTYDNTILYTDYIISSLIDVMKKYPQFESGLVYVSDHGESLGENNIYLHGMPYKIAPSEQTQVPMVLWMSEAMKKWDYVDYECMKKQAAQNTYSHDNLFHSILGLLEIDTQEYEKTYDIFNNCRTKPLPSETD